LYRIVLARLLDTLPLVLLLTLVTFGMLKVARGDIVDALYGDSLEYMTPDQVAQIRSEYGVDQPLVVQYASWLRGLTRGDFGRDLATQRPIAEIIVERLPYTVRLGGLSLLTAILLGVPLGVVAATGRHRQMERAIKTFAAVAMALPGFWLGLGLILVFTVWLHWLPSSGPFSTDSQRSPLLDAAAHTVLPVLALAAWNVGAFIRYTAASVEDALAVDFIRTAWAKGLSEWQVNWRHALPNALLPLITLVGLRLPLLVNGTVAIEDIFGWPGLGRLFVDAAMKRDTTLLSGTLLVTGLVVILGNLVADLAYLWADPRLRTGERP
jgi:peptide/nickel transport system permease protein